MTLKKILLGALALFAFASVSAQETYFDFSFSSGSGYSGSGILGGTSIGSGEFLINSISGNINGAIPVLLAPTTTPYTVGGVAQTFNGHPIFQIPTGVGSVYAFNDILYTKGGTPGNTPFDLYGLGLTTSFGNNINIYNATGTGTGTGLVYLDNGRLLSFGGSASLGNVPINMTITAAVPEPGTYSMLLAGLAALGFIAIRKQRSAPMAAAVA